MANSRSAPAAPAAPALKQVPVAVVAPAAKEVILTGDFTGWALDQVRLQRASGGEWRAMLSLAPGEYQYRLRVDGEWRDDERATRRVTNPFGTQNDVLVVS